MDWLSHRQMFALGVQEYLKAVRSFNLKGAFPNMSTNGASPCGPSANDLPSVA